ncbi:MAG: D-alanyl-D-alanine carboxypeptidase, partial [Leptolyngbyaceae cyanobacterium RM2_2_21]|nr:D-alanyl-D-alanine carboxypeptidase [Leptolyngbyaceae cyanobacterium RM2_2_21]
RDRGLVWFAILNQGGNLEGLRQGQDDLLRAMQQHWGSPPALPDALVPTVDFEQDAYRLGNPQRNQSFSR